MTNPSNSVGTNGAYGGRTSVNALNDVLAAFGGRGIITGWACSPSSGMTVALGGDGLVRDVALAEDNAGNKTTINNISQAPISLTLSAAPTTGSRVDAIVAYVDNPPSVSTTALDNPGAVGLVAVSGTEGSSPTAPTESDIRTAITSDGASGATAYYVVLAYVLVASGTTDIDATMITAGDTALLNNEQIGDGQITSDNVDWTTLDFATWFSTTNTSAANATVVSPRGNTYQQQPVNAGSGLKIYGTNIDNVSLALGQTHTNLTSNVSNPGLGIHGVTGTVDVTILGGVLNGTVISPSASTATASGSNQFISPLYTMTMTNCSGGEIVYRADRRINNQWDIEGYVKVWGARTYIKFIIGAATAVNAETIPSPYISGFANTNRASSRSTVAFIEP